MRKYIIVALLLTLVTMSVSAQTSSMTDEQVLSYVLEEREAGTSNQQIVIKLMQKGVTTDQIQRVRRKAQRMQSNQGMGALNQTAGDTDDRTRKNNGKTRKQMAEEDGERVSPYRQRDLRTTTSSRMKKKNKNQFDETDEDMMLMMGELEEFVPDTAAMLDQLLKEKEEMQKRIFGHDIFNNEELTFEPAMNIATPENYRLGPGDAVYIDIFGASQKSVQATVSPDGTIVIEGFGPVNVGGMTVSQANAHLRQTLGERYSSSQVKLTVGQTRTITVNVFGEVNLPGTYTVSAFATVFHALYLAGGVSDIGTLRNIKVLRGGKQVSSCDVYDFIMNGRQTGNVRLADNDVIYVGPYDCLVNVTGKVKRPMYYEMKKSESVGTLLKYAGGFTGDAYTKSVRVVRKTGREFSVYNVEEFDLNAFHVNDGDSVSVDSILPRFANMVEVKGAVFRPGMYQVGGEITSVRSLLEHAEGVLEEAFTARAVMHRMKPDRTLKVISIDVEGILNGTSADVPLQPNDVLFIPTKQEMMEEQTITIHGEVQFPGIYKYADNETIEDFVLQAGGLKETASTVKVDVARRIVDPKALTTDTLIAHTFSFALKDGFVIDGEPGFVLMPFDEVYVRKSPGYYKQQNVEIDGEVMFSGTYTLSKKNQRLSDLVKAAGGVNDRAYVRGARLERKYNEEERLKAEAVLRKAREEIMTDLQEQAARTGNANLANLNTSQQTQKYQIAETYPVGIELDKALKNPGGPEDVVLREGDRLVVPQYNATVKINGEVMYPNTVGYMKGKNVSYYIDQAGGFNSKAKKSQTYIIYMNGTIAKVGHNAKPEPGCEIMVPAKNLSKLTMSERLSMATSAGSFAAIIATIINILK